MHTEALFKTDDEFFQFTREHHVDLKSAGRNVPAPSSLLATLSDTNAKDIRLCFELKKRPDASLLFMDVTPLSDIEPHGKKAVIARANFLERRHGLRVYTTLRNPNWHAPLVCIDTFDSQGFISDKKFHKNGIAVKAWLSGVALSIRHPDQPTHIVIQDNAHVQYRRLIGELKADEPAEFDFYHVRSLDQEDSKKAPEAYSFMAIIEDVVPLKWFGRQLYVLTLRGSALDERDAPVYSLVTSEATLNGYRPRIGENVTGIAALCVHYALLDPKSKAYKDLVVAEREVSKRQRHKPGKVASRKTYPWGTVEYDRHHEMLSITPNKKYPVVSKQVPSFPLPDRPTVGKKISHFRSKRLPCFCFLDEFAAKMPRDLEPCVIGRKLALKVFDQIGSYRMDWSVRSRRDDFGLIQTGRSKSGPEAILRFSIATFEALVPVDLLAIVNIKNGRLIRYTVEFPPVPLFRHMPMFRVNSEFEDRCGSVTSWNDLKAFIQKAREDDYLILQDPCTGGFIQFRQNEGNKWVIEFQIGTLTWQFGRDGIAPTNFEELCHAYLDRDYSLFPALKWSHVFIKDRKPDAKAKANK